MFPSATTSERNADFLVHVAGLVFLAPASVFLVRAALATGDAILVAGVGIYALAAIFSISISFAYHLLPRHDLRPMLRRWDHAAIYVVIAGVFSPLLRVCDTWSAYVILGLLWAFALGGVTYKLAGGNPDSKWSLISYLGMGWFALVALPDSWVGLPRASVALIAIGGVLYTVGTHFYRKKTMRYRFPIWHAFGTCGGLSFFFAIWLAVSGV